MPPDVEIPRTKSFWSQADARTPELAEGGPPMAFALATIETESGPRPLLFGAFRFSTTFADRFAPSMPEPIFVVAVNRATGAVQMRELTRDDGPPVAVLHPGAAPKPLWRVEGKAVEGPDVLVGGNVIVNLAMHLGLGPTVAVYDVFLWIDEYATDTQELKTTGGLQDGPEPALYRRPHDIVATTLTQADTLEARIEADATGVWIKGRAPVGPATILAVSAMKRQIGWTRFFLGEGEAAEFTVRAEDLIENLATGERFLAFVFAGGKRSALLDSADR